MTFFFLVLLLLNFFFGLLLTHNFLHDRASSSSTVEFSSISWKAALIVKHNYNGKKYRWSIDRPTNWLIWEKKSICCRSWERWVKRWERKLLCSEVFFVLDLILDACGSGRVGRERVCESLSCILVFVARQAGAGCWWISWVKSRGSLQEEREL